MANLKTLNTLIAREHQWPGTRDNPVWFHLGAWWNNEPRVREIFDGIGDIETLNRASQFLQAEGLRYAVESNWRRMYRNSGSLPWQFNESSPNAFCTAAVDYNAHPKPVYYAVARAYAPVHVMAQFETQAWGGRSDFEAAIWAANSYEHGFQDAMLAAWVVGASGRRYAGLESPVVVEGNRAARLVEITLPLEELDEDIFFLDLRLVAGDGPLLSQNRYLFTCTENLAPVLALPLATLAVEREIEGDCWTLTVTNTGESAALCVWL